MSESDILSDIQFGRPEVAATRLKDHDHEAESPFQLFERAVRDRPEVTTTVLEGVCRSAPSKGLACRDLLREACHCDDEGVRRELVRTFRRARRDEELFLGAALLTRDDGSRVFSDFFEEGGQPHEVVHWISTLAMGYRREKRRGNIKPSHDGIFADAWNEVKEVGKDIGQTITDAVDKVEDALKNVGEDLSQVVSDVAEFTQRRINSVMETVFTNVADAAAQVGRFLEAATAETYSSIKRVVKGIKSGLSNTLGDAQEALNTIVAKATEVGSGMLATVTRALKESRETIEDIAEAASKLTKEAAATVTQALIDMVEYAQKRASEVVDAFEEAVEDAQEFLEYLYERFENYVDEWLRKAKEFGENLGADAKALLINAARTGRDALKSTLQGLLDVGVSIGWILEVVNDNVSRMFETLVDLLASLVRRIEDLYQAASNLGVLASVTKILADIGEAVDGLVQWAADKGRSVVATIHSVIGDITRIGRNAVYHLAEAIEDFGLAIEGLLDRVFEWGGRLPYVAFYGIIAGGGTVFELLQYIYDTDSDYETDGGNDLLTRAVEILREIGINIHEILAAGARLGTDIIRDIIEYFRGVERSVWHLLEWLALGDPGKDLVMAVFEGLKATGIEIGQLASWCLRQAESLLQAGLKVLIAIWNGVREVAIALLENDNNVFSVAVKQLQKIGTSLKELFKALWEAPAKIIKRLIRALEDIGTNLDEMLDAMGDAVGDMFDEEAFSRLTDILLDMGYKVFDVVLWAVNQSFRILGWVMDVVETVLDSWVDLLEFVAGLAPQPIKKFGRWLAEYAAKGIEFIRDDIVLPILQAGKIYILIAIGQFVLPFAIVALIAAGSLVDKDATPYRQWPAEFRAFECHIRARSTEIAPPTEERSIVVMSDLHAEDQDDIDGDLGHFYHNADLMASVLEYYAQDDGTEWTVVLNGDTEEFWKDHDLTTAEPSSKVNSIRDTHQNVYDRLSEEFYKFEFPRRLVKLRGNHDAAYQDPHVVSSLRGNGFPDIEVYDYVTTQFQGDDLLILHGQQFDDYNCAANDQFGRFASNFASEPLDVWNDTLTDLFGEDARIEGETIEFDPLDLTIPLDFLLPYYEPADWRPKVEGTGVEESTVMEPKVDDGTMFEESRVVNTVDEFGSSMIIGHTHDPKLMTSAKHHSDEKNVFYANTGTSGWWEGCVWTVEITHENVRLVGWTDDGDGGRDRTYVVGLNEPEDGANDRFDPTKENQMVTSKEFVTESDGD